MWVVFAVGVIEDRDAIVAGGCPKVWGRAGPLNGMSRVQVALEEQTRRAEQLSSSLQSAETARASQQVCHFGRSVFRLWCMGVSASPTLGVVVGPSTRTFKCGYPTAKYGNPMIKFGRLNAIVGNCLSLWSVHTHARARARTHTHTYTITFTFTL